MPHVYQNSRRQIEQTIGLEAMRLVFFCCAFGPSQSDTAKTKALFDQAIAESASGGSERDRIRQRKRVVTLLQTVMVKPFVERRDPASKFGLAVYYLLRNLVEIGMITLDDGSKADQAFEQSLHMLSAYTSDSFAPMDEAAFRAAQDMLERLQAAGYFRDAVWQLAFERSSTSID